MSYYKLSDRENDFLVKVETLKLTKSLSEIQQLLKNHISSRPQDRESTLRFEWTQRLLQLEGAIRDITEANNNAAGVLNQYLKVRLHKEYTRYNPEINDRVNPSSVMDLVANLKKTFKKDGIVVPIDPEQGYRLDNLQWVEKLIPNTKLTENTDTKAVYFRAELNHWSVFIYYSRIKPAFSVNFSCEDYGFFGAHSMALATLPKLESLVSAKELSFMKGDENVIFKGDSPVVDARILELAGVQNAVEKEAEAKKRWQELEKIKKPGAVYNLGQAQIDRAKLSKLKQKVTSR